MQSPIHAYTCTYTYTYIEVPQYVRSLSWSVTAFALQPLIPLSGAGAAAMTHFPHCLTYFATSIDATATGATLSGDVIHHRTIEPSPNSQLHPLYIYYSILYPCLLSSIHAILSMFQLLHFCFTKIIEILHT